MRAVSTLPVLLALAAAACSSGGGSTPPPEATFSSDVRITANNAFDVAKATIRSAFDVQRVFYNCASFVRQQPPDFPDPPKPFTSLSKTIFGTFGGEALFTWTDTNGDENYTTGDVFSVTFDDFLDANGEPTLSGSVEITNFVLDGQLPTDGAWIVTADLNFVGLTARVGTQEANLDLVIPFRMENRVFVELFEVRLPEDVFFGPYQLFEGSRIARYENNDDFFLQYNGSVFSPELGGRIRFATPGTLSGSTFFADPSSGVILVDGIVGVLELEMGFFTLTIRVDEEGDNDFETEIMSSFFELIPN